MVDHYQIWRTWRRSSCVELLKKLSRYLVMRFDLAIFPLYRGLVREPGKPDFIVIGAQKAGTTWLHHVLSSLPGVSVPAGKELHYFDRGFDWTVLRYLRHFQGDGIQGEITPDYSALGSFTVRQIRRILPEVKIILIVREPLERAWSAARMELGLEESREVSEVPESEMLMCLRSARTIRRTDYASIVKTWLSVFPQDQFLLLDYESISVAPKCLIGKIADFIGVEFTDVDESTLSQRVFEGNSSKIPDRVRLLVEPAYARLRRDANQTFERVGFRVHW
jgi:hypothetical protein